MRTLLGTFTFVAGCCCVPSGTLPWQTGTTTPSGAPTPTSASSSAAPAAGAVPASTIKAPTLADLAESTEDLWYLTTTPQGCDWVRRSADGNERTILSLPGSCPSAVLRGARGRVLLDGDRRWFVDASAGTVTELPQVDTVGLELETMAFGFDFGDWPAQVGLLSGAALGDDAGGTLHFEGKDHPVGAAGEGKLVVARIWTWDAGWKVAATLPTRQEACEGWCLRDSLDGANDIRTPGSIWSGLTGGNAEHAPAAAQAWLAAHGGDKDRWAACRGPVCDAAYDAGEGGVGETGPLFWFEAGVAAPIVLQSKRPWDRIGAVGDVVFVAGPDGVEAWSMKDRSTLFRLPNAVELGRWTDAEPPPFTAAAATSTPTSTPNTAPGMDEAELRKKLARVLADVDEIRSAELMFDAVYDTYVAAPTWPRPLGDLDGNAVAWPEHPAWKKLGWAPSGPVWAHYEVELDGSGFIVRGLIDADDDQLPGRVEATQSRGAQVVSPPDFY